MRLRIATALTAGLALVSGAALAQVIPASQGQMMQGLYLSAGGGASWHLDTNVEANDYIDCGVPGRFNFKTGWTVNGAVGYAFGFGPRVEVEVNHRQNNMGKWHAERFGGCFGDAEDGSVARGRVGQTGIFGNLLIDFATGTPFVPYVGAGLGAVRVALRGPLGNAYDDGDGLKDTQWTYGVQGMMGVDYLVTQALRIGLRGTYQHTGNLDSVKTIYTTCCPTQLVGHSSYDPDNLAATVQIAYNFGAPRQIAAPPPAPVAAPAPALQRNFLVFFDFDKSDITPEADRVIVQAANNAKTASVTRITLTGHTDRAGPVAYNQRLSERRADAVKARLVREGIPAGSIVTIGRGETQNLVPTADGVREPQNRRVEIVL